MFDIPFNLFYIETIFRYLLYVIILIGAWFFVSPFIKPYITSRQLLLKNLSLTNNSININNRFYKHIERLLSVTLNKRSSYAVMTFIMLSVSIFGFSILFFLRTNQSFTYTISLSLLFSLLPYIVLRIKLNSIQIESSYEAVPLVTELSNNYKIFYLNMIEAIDVTTVRLKNLPYTKKALSRMSFRLKQYKNMDELEDIIQEFNYSINTQWSINLSNSIYFAVSMNHNVTESFYDILNQLSGLKKVNEKNKQSNNETFFIMKFGGLLAYFVTVFIMFNKLNFTIQKFIDYQFKSAEGFRLFTMMLAALAINYIIYFLVRKPKNDF